MTADTEVKTNVIAFIDVPLPETPWVKEEVGNLNRVFQAKVDEYAIWARDARSHRKLVEAQHDATHEMLLTARKKLQQCKEDLSTLAEALDMRTEDLLAQASPVLPEAPAAADSAAPPPPPLRKAAADSVAPPPPPSPSRKAAADSVAPPPPRKAAAETVAPPPPPSPTAFAAAAGAALSATPAQRFYKETSEFIITGPALEADNAVVAALLTSTGQADSGLGDEPTAYTAPAVTAATWPSPPPMPPPGQVVSSPESTGQADSGLGDEPTAYVAPAVIAKWPAPPPMPPPGMSSKRDAQIAPTDDFSTANVRSSARHSRRSAPLPLSRALPPPPAAQTGDPSPDAEHSPRHVNSSPPAAPRSPGTPEESVSWNAFLSTAWMAPAYPSTPPPPAQRPIAMPQPAGSNFPESPGTAIVGDAEWAIIGPPSGSDASPEPKKQKKKNKISW